MELKATILAILLLLLLPAPGFSTGRLHVKSMGSEVYVIDYRGPETHTYFPPPSRAESKPDLHHQTRKARRESKSDRSGKKIRGR